MYLYVFCVSKICIKGAYELVEELGLSSILFGYIIQIILRVIIKGSLEEIKIGVLASPLIYNSLSFLHSFFFFSLSLSLSLSLSFSRELSISLFHGHGN
jgi:hypothetical protein